MGKTDKTKVVALDIYGTMLPTKGRQVKRKGLDALLQKCKNKGLILCTCSDAEINEMLIDFEEADLNRKYFDRFFKMKKGIWNEPKNFSPILKHYNLIPWELTIIGDRKERDIKPALYLGCKAILVPEYKFAKENDFDLNEINLY